MNCQPQGRRDDLEVWSSRKRYQSLPSSSTPSLICHKGKGSASSTGGGGRRRFPPLDLAPAPASGAAASQKKKKKGRQFRFDEHWHRRSSLAGCFLPRTMRFGALCHCPDTVSPVSVWCLMRFWLASCMGLSQLGPSLPCLFAFYQFVAYQNFTGRSNPTHSTCWRRGLCKQLTSHFTG